MIFLNFTRKITDVVELIGATFGDRNIESTMSDLIFFQEKGDRLR